MAEVCCRGDTKKSENTPDSFSGKSFPQHSGQTDAVDDGMDRMTLTQSAKTMLDMLSDLSLSEGLLSDVSFRDFEPEARQNRFVRQPEARQHRSLQQPDVRPNRDLHQPEIRPNTQSSQSQQVERPLRGSDAINWPRQEPETSLSRPSSSRPTMSKQHQSSSSSHRLTFIFNLISFFNRQSLLIPRFAP